MFALGGTSCDLRLWQKVATGGMKTFFASARRRPRAGFLDFWKHNNSLKRRGGKSNANFGPFAPNVYSGLVLSVVRNQKFRISIENFFGN
jgi:hypothetical protein